MRKMNKADNSVIDLENFPKRLSTPRIQPENQISRSQLKRILRYFVHRLTLAYIN